MKKVVMFENSRLPDGSPNAIRMVFLAMLIKAIGFSVQMLGVSRNIQDKKGIYGGVPYENLVFDELNCVSLNRGKRIRKTKNEICNWIRVYTKNNQISYFIFSDDMELTAFLTKLAVVHDFKSIVNCVEWYSLKSFTGMGKFIKIIQNRTALRYWFVKTKNIIVISSLLDNYYKKRGCNTVRIPTVIDINEYLIPNIADVYEEKTILMYAGSPGKKDNLKNVILAFLNMTMEEKERIEFRIYGMTEEEFQMNYDIDLIKDSLDNCIKVFGRIPYPQVKKELTKAHFTILLRENMRASNAGFPTKIGESMAAGVPVIANLTSDIGMYLHDGIEGLVCAAPSAEECLRTLRKAMDLSMEEKNELRKHAYLQAQKSFSYLAYSDKLKHFISECK